VCASRARQQKAQKPRVLKFHRPIAFGRGFSAGYTKGFKTERARYTKTLLHAE
jgi:hypothetical protein